MFGVEGLISDHSNVIDYDSEILSSRGIPSYVGIRDNGVGGEEYFGGLIIVIYGSFFGVSFESGLKLLKSCDRENIKKQNPHRLADLISPIYFHKKPYIYSSRITSEHNGIYQGKENIFDQDRRTKVYSSTFVVTPSIFP